MHACTHAHKFIGSVQGSVLWVNSWRHAIFVTAPITISCDVEGMLSHKCSPARHGQVAQTWFWREPNGRCEPRSAATPKGIKRLLAVPSLPAGCGCKRNQSVICTKVPQAPMAWPSSNRRRWASAKVKPSRTSLTGSSNWARSNSRRACIFKPAAPGANLPHLPNSPPNRIAISSSASRLPATVAYSRASKNTLHLWLKDLHSPQGAEWH